MQHWQRYLSDALRANFRVLTSADQVPNQGG
jgi:hypothetical protein